MELFPIDDDGRLYISGDIDDWKFIAPHGIDVVIDLLERTDVTGHYPFRESVLRGSSHPG